MKNYKTYIYIIVIVTALIVTVVGLTYAYFSWNSTSENKDVTVNVTVEGLSENDITYTASTNNVELIPVASKDSGRITTISISQSAIASATATFYLTLTTLPSSLINSTLKYEFVSVSGGNETTLTPSNSNFSTNSQGDTITLTTQTLSQNTTYNYKLYIWIDGTVVNPNVMQNQDYQFDLYVEVTDQV